MPRPSAAITPEDAREILGDAILTNPPRLTRRACTKPRCTTCGRHARLNRLGTCRTCA